MSCLCVCVCGEHSWKREKTSISPFHFEINFDTMLQLVFHSFTRFFVWRVDEYTLSYYSLFALFSFSFHFAHWINLFTAFPHLSAYATTNLNIQTHSDPIHIQLWNVWADHNPWQWWDVEPQIESMYVCARVCVCVSVHCTVILKQAFNITFIHSCKRGRKRFHRFHLNIYKRKKRAKQEFNSGEKRSYPLKQANRKSDKIMRCSSQ